MQKVTIGRIVIYRSRTGDYDVPAIVNATVDTLNRKGVEAGYVPDLTGNACVHLTVLSPGLPGLGHAHEAPKFLVETTATAGDEPVPVSANNGGTYQEWDIPMSSSPEAPEPGSWRWPEVVR